MSAARAQVAPHANANDPTADEILALASSLDLSERSVWASLPELAMRLVSPGEVLAGRSYRAAGRMRNLGRAMLSGRGPGFTRVGPVLFLSTSVQTDRVLRPVIDELARVSEPAKPFNLPALGPVQAIAAQRSARQAHRVLKGWLRASGLTEPDGIEEELAKAEILLRQGADSDLCGGGIRVLVVASQHNNPTRAVIAAAHGAPDGPATVYLPHAPVADNPFYRDLPVHYALLRGPSEVDFYRACGIEDTDAIRIVGQPGLPSPLDVAVPEADHVVYAATSYAEDVLQADIEVIQRSVERPVEVCPHPRMSPEFCAEVFPAEWIVHPPGRTLQVLKERGASVVIQHGSGVGLEVLGLGVDVIDLCPSEERPNYPYLSPPHVQLAADDVELRSAIRAISGRRDSHGDRVRFARSWCSEFDPAASVAAVTAIRSILLEDRPHTVLLDGWIGAS